MTRWIREQILGPLDARRRHCDYSPWLRPMKADLAALASPHLRETLQVERTAAILEHAYETSPFYRELYDEHGFTPKIFRDLRDLRNVPILEKTMIAGQQHRIRSRVVPDSALIPSSTGGTTGNSFAFWYDRECFCRRGALTLLGNRRYGWRYGDPVAYVWNAHQDIPKLGRWKGALRNWLTERRYILDATRIDEKRLESWVRLLEARRVEILYGYAHSVAILATYVAATKSELPAIRLVVTTAEPLYARDRILISNTFGCPVHDRYGSREHGLMAQEDGGVLGVFANSVMLEIDAAPGQPGDILVTDFWNRGFPLVRYRIGDTGTLTTGESTASGLPAFGHLTGRQTDFLIATDGSRVSGMTFHEAYFNARTRSYGTDSLLAIQFVQTEPRRVVVRLVPGPTYDPELTHSHLQALVKRTLGETVEIQFSVVAEIPRTRSGKYRFTVNEMETLGESGQAGKEQP